MSSSKRQTVSRENGKKSMGPTSVSGKRRSSGNAFKHGLSVDLPRHPEAIQTIDDLASLLAAERTDPIRFNLCRTIAEAHLELVRIRRARIDIWSNDALRRRRTTRKDIANMRREYKGKIKAIEFHDPDYQAFKKDDPDFAEFYRIDQIFDLSTQYEQKLLSFNREPVPFPQGIDLIAGRLNSLERYERRALTRRNKALAALHAYDEEAAFIVNGG
jgi:hypothetical protein